MNERLVNIFRIDEHLIALPVKKIVQIIRSAQLKPIQGLPASIKGILNFHGELLPVVDLRYTMNLTPQDLSTDDRFVIISSSIQRFAIVVSEVQNICKLDDQHALDLSTLSARNELETLSCLDERTVLIINTDHLLSENDIELLHYPLTINPNKKLSA